ncbi:hypothetical protein LCM02_12405 [Lutimonas saemankumensis]|uniref:hypothetical protein n=1 Tax=Lutimonas saemankumensis TaxID=483016 RepID=UPI001CD7AE8F|nr:hypothetical protein [Lutimonas saemankumensis]MCA0933256.1 hypothetical protein [Lutimonas saemankumensis]
MRKYKVFRITWNKIKYLPFILGLIAFNGCVSLKEPTVTKDSSINNYQYVVIPETSDLASSTGSVYGNQYGTYGGSVSKEVNPGEVIEGILLKKGFTTMDQVRQDKVDKTLIVKYGESGKRSVSLGLGYTLEVTIILIDANTYDTIYSCTAEGIGSTEADDIREAITRCLDGL